MVTRSAGPVRGASQCRSNTDGRVDIEARVQTGQRTMHVMMGAVAYGCSGVAPPLPHLQRSTKDDIQLGSISTLRERDSTARTASKDNIMKDFKSTSKYPSYRGVWAARNTPH